MAVYLLRDEKKSPDALLGSINPSRPQRGNKNVKAEIRPSCSFIVKSGMVNLISHISFIHYLRGMRLVTQKNNLDKIQFEKMLHV